MEATRSDLPGSTIGWDDSKVPAIHLLPDAQSVGKQLRRLRAEIEILEDGT